MASRGKRQRPKEKRAPDAAPLPAARVVPPRVNEPRMERIGRGEVIGGALLLVGAVVYGQTLPPTATLGTFGFLVLSLLELAGAIAIAVGGYHLDRRADLPVTPDPRRWIYGGLGVLFGLFFGFAMIFVMPNRLPSGMMHLAAIPLFTLMMAAGALVGQRIGWWLAVVGGSLVLAVTFLLIVRMVASAAFLAGVYGAFGKAASTFALVAAALIVELVALLPICQVRFLMARVGRRAYGI